MSPSVAAAARGLTVAYHSTPVLRDISLTVPVGVVMGVVGPNGSGKSTLLKAMLGLVPPASGDALFFGRPLAQVRQQVGYMPQHTSVDWDFPTTVADVVLMGTYGRLGWLRRPGRAEKQAAARAMEATCVTDLADRQIGQLSGGQRQRVFLARTLAQEPDLFIMDEPFQGVDAFSQQAIVDVLHDLRAQGRTVILVHHDLSTVADYCDHVTLLGGDARRGVVASGEVSTHFTHENIAAAYGLSVTP
ncbi:ABC transporter [Corynebacterium humireducens NBRC 106098 = DSM 45392]|uniref:ABC transporter n=1 Tax=Corynebacterium humireducens NBRC 106098 = DSM 45392 TaxID=1223515 RepID=A0A0B5D0J3_9CORY|nr:metal ABC transporter ATP-binding protein [Corynebacterium humireducens]AJE32320.1 ABC transporter [Corynebacterium humireducens NBRC 106098 = DSM 45392]